MRVPHMCILHPVRAGRLFRTHTGFIVQRGHELRNGGDGGQNEDAA